MSLSQGLYSAFTGLSAAARAAGVVADNLANIHTPGYMRRELPLTAAPHGGVLTGNAVRQANPGLVGERRLAQAALDAATVRLTFHATLEERIGLPGADGALSTRIGRFEAAVLNAAASPDSPALLAGVLDTATDLAAGFNALAEHVQQARQQADGAIRADIATFNANLRQIAEINGQILRLAAQRQDHSALQDHRQTLVDELAAILPLHEVQHDNGQIRLYTVDGVALLNAVPATMAMVPSGFITAERTGLPGLTLDGRPVVFDGGGASGRLAANLAIRDQLAPQAQQALDVLATELLTRTAAADPTLPAGMPGLFTDGGATLVPPGDAGLAGRLQVNAAVRPEMGGQLWRIRTGMGATAPGAADDSAVLGRLAAALSLRQAPADPALGLARNDLAGLAGQLAAGMATGRLGDEQAVSFASARQTTLARSEAARTGVDSDHELQVMLQVETAYAANARVIQAIDAMLASLLEL